MQMTFWLSLEVTGENTVPYLLFNLHLTFYLDSWDRIYLSSYLDLFWGLGNALVYLTQKVGGYLLASCSHRRCGTFFLTNFP